jgi:hypothetical protein
MSDYPALALGSFPKGKESMPSSLSNIHFAFPSLRVLIIEGIQIIHAKGFN